MRALAVPRRSCPFNTLFDPIVESLEQQNMYSRCSHKPVPVCCGSSGKSPIQKQTLALDSLQKFASCSTLGFFRTISPPTLRGIDNASVDFDLLCKLSHVCMT